MSCLSFSVSHSSFYFRSFCPVAFSFSGCFLNRLLCFYFRFHGGGLCYYAITSRRYAPLALLATLKNAYSPCPYRAVFCLALLILTYLYLFLLFRPFFDFDLDIVCFSSCLLADDDDDDNSSSSSKNETVESVQRIPPIPVVANYRRKSS